MDEPENEDGGNYACAWKKEGKGYRISVKGHPELIGSGATFGEARSDLAERILLDLGDGEPTFQFDGPLPKGVLPEEYSLPEIIWIGGDDTALAEDPGKLFDGGICSICGNPVGKRNGRAARLSSPPLPKSDAAEVRHLGTLYSESFVELLDAGDGPRLEFREVKCEGVRKLYELAGKPLADCVAAEPFLVQGVKCAKCDRKVFHQMVGGELIPFLAREDLPDPPPRRFLIRSRETLRLCMTGPAWRALQGKPGTSKVVGIQIGVAAGKNVVRDPDLPLFNG